MFSIGGGYSLIEHNNAYSEVFDGWHQFIYAYDGAISTSQISIDGTAKLAEVATVNRTDQRFPTPTPLTVGNYTYSENGNTAGGYAGTPFSDMMVYDRPRGASSRAARAENIFGIAKKMRSRSPTPLWLRQPMTQSASRPHFWIIHALMKAMREGI